MKKSLSRLLSLALVLVMVLGMVPMALADAPTTVTVADATVEQGKDVTVTAVIPEGYVAAGTWNWLYAKTSDVGSAVYEGITVGTHNLTVSGQIKAADDTSETPTLYNVTGSFKVTVTEAAPAEPTDGSVAVSGAATVMVEEKVTLTATVTAPEGYTQKGEVVWTGATVDETDSKKATVTSETAAEISVTATATFQKEGATDVTRTSEAVKVKFVDAYTVSCDTEALTVQVAEKKTAKITVTPTAASGISVAWTSEKPAIASVSDGTVTGVTVGETKIYAVVSAAEGMTLAGAGEDGKVTFEIPVKVSGGTYIDCDSISFKLGSYDYLEPIAVGVPADATTKFAFSESSTAVSISDGGKVTSTSVALVPVTVSGYYVPAGATDVEANRVTIDSATVYVSVYDEHSVEVTLKETVPSTFKFTDTKLFTSAKYDGRAMNADQSLKDLLDEANANEIAFVKSYYSDNIGTLSHDTGYDRDSALMANMGRVTITLNGKSGTMIQTYTITASSAYDNVIVATGTLKVTTGGTVADITYTVGMNSKVTVDETDFNTFFKKSGKTGNLAYVVFDITNTSPDEGYLYTKVPTVTTQDLASARMLFHYQYNSATDKNANDYDLDTVTYLPNKYAGKAYTDTVAFTCYSTTGAEVPGILAFEVGQENPFTDVKESDYFYDAVMWAVGEGVTTGQTATTFAPNAACTRGQVVTFLWRAAGKPEPKSSVNKFTDVKKNDYYYDAVLWAVEKGITTGMTDTTFAPNAACTRAQVVTFLYRAAGEPTTTGTNKFTDVSASAYYYDAVRWAVKNGITTGMSTTSFGSNSSCTRGQIVTFLYRYYKD